MEGWKEASIKLWLSTSPPGASGLSSQVCMCLFVHIGLRVRKLLLCLLDTEVLVHNAHCPSMRHALPRGMKTTILYPGECASFQPEKHHLSEMEPPESPPHLLEAAVKPHPQGWAVY